MHLIMCLIETETVLSSVCVCVGVCVSVFVFSHFELQCYQGRALENKANSSDF